MREVIKSAISFSWASSVLAMAQMTRMLGGERPETAVADSDHVWEAPARPGGRMVVLGEGLAAGVGDFAWNEEAQPFSFVAQAARQMGMPFAQPLIQSPGIYGAPGLPPQPVVLPHLLQTTVVDEFPVRRRYNDLAIPGYELADALRRRPAAPLVHRDDPRQTAANLVLGLAALTTEPGGRRETQLEYAVAAQPTLAIIVLGYTEVLRMAFGVGRVAPDQWSADLDQVVRALRACGADVVVATVPDPAHTGGCLALDAAARALRVAREDLQQRYGLAAGDCLTIAGLTRAAFQVLGGHGEDLGADGIVRAETRTRVADTVQRMNQAVHAVTRQHGAHVFDLHAVLRTVCEAGVRVGNRLVSADFLGGFYTLNGVYPGATGHAVIANALLARLGDVYGARYRDIDLDDVATLDPVPGYRAPGGGDRPVPPPLSAPAFAGRAPSGRGAPVTRGALPLQLPSSLEMTVPLSRAGSYHGDAIRVVDCRDQAEMRFGSCPGVLFGGPVLYDSHLSGSIRIRFTPPEGNLTRFEITFEPLMGEDGVLSAPMFFRWPVQQAVVMLEPNATAGGTLDLATGEVTDLSVAVRYLNSALQALVSVNPGFPDQPIVFPGEYGSAWAKFDPREDGTLDFTFYGSTFLPLGGEFGGEMVRWALPFAGAPFHFASIPARGMALHPHLQLSTRDPHEEVELVGGGRAIELPHNALCELTLFTRRSSFGDRFTLNTPELGGPATGRSHLLGRLLLQTGEPFGTSMPVALSLMTPGGLLGQQAPPPLAMLFPGRLSPGPVGHDEHLRFPVRNYFLDAVTLVDDPFDFSVGAVDLRSGRFINQVLHRGFIGQDLFFSLVRVEPRTPQSSFLFRGPAAIERGAGGDLVFRHRGVVTIPYPSGFAFPAPDLTSAIVVGDGSVLDPYLWLRASFGGTPVETATVGRDRMRSSTGEEFSFRLEARHDTPQPLAFEYTNHAQGGTFQLQTVSWFNRAAMSTPAGECEVWTFAGFGRWSKDPTGRAHQAAVQVAVGAEEYVSVQIDAGLVSNVNTRPAEEAAAWP